MTKIVFNENRNSNGYLTGNMPEIPTESKLRRKGQRNTEIVPQDDKRSDFDMFKDDDIRGSSDRKDRLFKKKRNCEKKNNSVSYHQTSDPFQTRRLPFWALSIIVCAFGAAALLMPYVNVIFNNNGITSNLSFCALDNVSGEGFDNILNFAFNIPTWMFIIPPIILACLAVFFLITKERSADMPVIPITAGIAVVVVAFMFNKKVTKTCMGFIDIAPGIAQYVVIGCGIAVAAISVISAITKYLEVKRTAC